MQLHNLFAQRQAQTRAALFPAHLYEGFEDTALLAVGNALATVFNAHDDPLPMPPCLQADLPATGGMAQGVVQQVIQHALQLRLIGIQHWQVRL